MSWAVSVSANHAVFAWQDLNGRCPAPQPDAGLDFGVLAVAGLECGDVRVGLVGDEALEAVTVHVGE
jgi:hypothetical protein